MQHQIDMARPPEYIRRPRGRSNLLQSFIRAKLGLNLGASEGCMTDDIQSGQPQERLKRVPSNRPLNLSAHRQNRGISLQHIAEQTKISIRFLRAIEDEDFEKLPGGVFNKSYLRQYAAAAGFDEATILSYYESVTNTEVPSQAPPAINVHGFLRRWFGRPAPFELS